MAHGKRCDLFDKLQAVDLRRLIQTVCGFSGVTPQRAY
jgi:hypothetical protein